jgi:hypothetical protein
VLVQFPDGNVSTPDWLFLGPDMGPAKQQRHAKGWMAEPLPMAKSAGAFMRVSKCD